jgi:hypothetical protein
MSRFLANLALRCTEPSPIRPRLFGPYEPGPARGPSFVEISESLEVFASHHRPDTVPGPEPSGLKPGPPTAFGRSPGTPPDRPVVDGAVGRPSGTRLQASDERPRTRLRASDDGGDGSGATAGPSVGQKSPAPGRMPPAQPIWSRSAEEAVTAALPRSAEVTPTQSHTVRPESEVPGPPVSAGRIPPRTPPATGGPATIRPAGAVQQTHPSSIDAANAPSEERHVSVGEQPRPAEPAEPAEPADHQPALSRPAPPSAELIPARAMVVPPDRAGSASAHRDGRSTGERGRREAARFRPAGSAGDALHTSTVSVTIGRIEVRAAAPAAEPVRPSPRREPTGLDEYLRRRSRRGGGA